MDNYKKKVILSISAIIFAIILISIFFILFVKKNNTITLPVSPQTYAVAISEKDGSYTAQLKVANKFYALTSINTGSYAIVSFNRTHDIMSLMCPDGYTNTDAYSPENIKIAQDPAVGSSFEIFPSQQEDVTITCVKQ